ncbi:MAG: ACT domain-containing protein [Propionibacteriaceae bacterium]|nr:ACT domain-containing protein [Propionibacteriaceae bacterium]
MYLLRVALPDRPGALGAVASALGAVGADINAVEIVERGDQVVIDDFMLAIPADVQPDVLVSGCAQVPGVEVLWVSFYPENWGLAADLDVVDAMAQHPEQAEALLTDAAPTTFHGAWALLLDRASGDVVHRSAMAPLGPQHAVNLFGDLSVAHVGEVGAEWSDGWGAHAVAVAPFRSGHTIVVGRPGPEFRASELARLRHMALMAGETDHQPVALRHE